MMNLASRFAETARRLPDKTAVHDQTGSYAYGALLDRAQALAARVRETTRREHVGVLAPTCAAFPIAYLAALLADKVAVPLNFLLDAQTLGFVAQDAGFDTIVASRHFEPMVAALGVGAVYVEDPAPPPPEPLVPTRGGDDAATILYTSGTTGVPKGATLTHRNFLSNVDTCVAHVGITEDEVLLGILPLFHSFGITTSVLIPLLIGCTVAYVPRFSPRAVFRAVARHGATICFAVASMYRVLLRAGRPEGLDRRVEL